MTKKDYSKNKFKSKNAAKDSSPVKAKKHLGQHFLKDETIARKIAETLTFTGYKNLIEIGPGTGVLTKYLLEQASLFKGEQYAITGNFPYNISTQIVFKLLELKEFVPEFTGMFQKEVAQRICEKEGSKTYGILSVLVQAFYDAEYLFTVPPTVFNPPPKVDSGVLRLKRKESITIDCNEKSLFKVVKAAFGQRRKTIRNSLKTFNLSDSLKEDTIFDKRPEQLSVIDFIALTNKIDDDTV